MKLLFLSGSRSRSAGGVFEVERSLALKLLHGHGVSIEAAGFRDENSVTDNRDWEPIQVNCFKRYGPKQFGYAPGLKYWLKSSQHDILHLHNLWMYTSLATLSWHRKRNRPYVVTPHGMLDPWALKNSGWKKRLAALLYDNRMLRNASVIHGFHAKDVADIRAYGLRNPIAVIPNGIDLPTVEPQTNIRDRRILFLGRIHPKKGLTELVEAWRMVSATLRNGWRLTIAGWDDGGHLPNLKKQVDQLGLQTSVEFLGPIFGEEKQRLLASVSGLVLPSFSEGLPMTVLEAWAYSIPVIMTDMCNLPEGFASSAAIKIEPTPQSISLGLSNFLEKTEIHRRQLGRNGRDLVEREFTWDRVADQMMDVYRWIQGKGTRPQHVHTI